MEIKTYVNWISRQIWDRLRSRKFTTLVSLLTILFIYVIYNSSFKPSKYRPDSHYGENECINMILNKNSEAIESMDMVVSHANNDEEKYVPYTGNGFIGVSLNSKEGIFGFYQKSLSLKFNYDPLAYIYIEGYEKTEVAYLDLLNGLAHKVQVFQKNDNKNCIRLTNTVFAHRTRPSLFIEQINFSNPTNDPLYYDVIQTGSIEWNNTQRRTERFKNTEFTITTGIINVLVENKEKHLCIAIATTKLANSVQIKPYDLNSQHYVLTVVKSTKVLLTAKTDTLTGTLMDLANQAKIEFEHSLDIGFDKLMEEHKTTWNKVWNTGFSISKSLASNALNGNQINSTIYYVLCNNQAPLREITFQNAVDLDGLNQLSLQNDRCYEGFSTLQATKLWKYARNENEISDLSSLWYLTLTKNGCVNFLKLGVDGIIQAIILSIGGLKFMNHHLELNLNPKQIHRNYMFRNINYGNTTYFNVTVEVGEDNHAKIYVKMENSDSDLSFYACDAGCIDESIRLVNHFNHEFPVKLTNPPTAILYITSDRVHASELKHILHVQEVELAPPQDVNSVALHRHGHQFAGLSIIFWTIFVFLIVVFHLFLCKLIFREILMRNTGDYEMPTHHSSRHRTRAV